ncbi:MAG: winged helix-turn-helix transcriptional regulator [Candidatus Bathyarchaeia archaeon]
MIMVGGEETLELTVKYRDVEAKFSGRPDEVIRAFFGFMSRVLPAYDFASQLTLTIDLEDLLRGIRGLIAFAPEGPVITVPREKVGGDRNLIMLNLIRAYVGYRTGRLEKDTLSMAEITASTGVKSGTVAARLSELTDMGLVERVGRGEYRVTTLGVKFFLDDVLPKIRAEVGVEG